MRKCAILLLFIGACGSDGGGGTTGPPAGQVGAVSGRVLSTGDTALANVTISATRAGQTTRTATTDGQGNFQISNLATGTWTVGAVVPTGYEADGSLTANASVTANQTANLATFRMRRVPTGPPPNLAQVSMTGSSFSPQSVTVAVGGTVRWTNNDAGIQHNSTAPGQWASPNLNQGQTFERVFPQAGTFQYSCTLHAGMNGTVVVQ